MARKQTPAPQWAGNSIEKVLDVVAKLELIRRLDPDAHRQLLADLPRSERRQNKID